MIFAAIVTAAGRGRRLGAGVPKALVLIDGVPLITLAVRQVAAVPTLDHLVVTAPESHIDQFHAAVVGAAGGVPITVVPGGAERSDSVRAGLAVLPDRYDGVLVHDAARPFAPVALFQAVMAAVRAGADGAVPGLAVTDTIKQVSADGSVVTTPDRASLRAIQTPQAFATAALRRVAVAGATATDDAALVEQAGGRVVVVAGSPAAAKITTPADLAALRQQVSTERHPDAP